MIGFGLPQCLLLEFPRFSLQITRFVDFCRDPCDAVGCTKAAIPVEWMELRTGRGKKKNDEKRKKGRIKKTKDKQDENERGKNLTRQGPQVLLGATL